MSCNLNFRKITYKNGKSRLKVIGGWENWPMMQQTRGELIRIQTSASRGVVRGDRNVSRRRNNLLFHLMIKCTNTEMYVFFFF